MDFSSWSPSHLIVAALAFATIIGQAIAVLARLKANTEQLQKQGETFVHAMERLEDRIDKRFEEVNQRLTDMQAEIRDVRSEMCQLNQNHINHLSHHES
jgi:predicted  nucleic acid-binding Zn-ribbon protein